VLGVSLAERALPVVTRDLYGMLLFMIGVSGTSDLPLMLKKLNDRLMQSYSENTLNSATVATTVSDSIAPDRN